MMDVKPLANRLVQKYQSRDPIDIAERMGCIIIRAPLAGVRGFYQYLKRCHLIYLNEELPECIQSYVCAHEIGHIVAHKGMAWISMDMDSNMAASRYEREADRFAVELMYSDEDMMDYLDYTIPQAARILRIDEDLAEYRIRSAIQGLSLDKSTSFDFI